MNLFERLDQGRPAPVEKPQEISPAQALLNWLQKWPKPTICTKEILQFGPRIVRNRKSTIDATETLVQHGWLNPQKTKQSNWRLWRIVRKPTIHPKVAG
jgi:hypothetical protein